MNKPMIKYAGVVIRNGKFLIVQDGGENFYKNVGGKPERDETPENCLKREIEEELGVRVFGEPKYYFSTPITPTASDPSLNIKIILYLVEIIGDPQPSGEIQSIHWLTKKEFEENKFNLTHQIKDYIMPKLIKDKLVN